MNGRCPVCEQNVPLGGALFAEHATPSGKKCPASGSTYVTSRARKPVKRRTKRPKSEVEALYHDHEYCVDCDSEHLVLPDGRMSIHLLPEGTRCDGSLATVRVKGQEKSGSRKTRNVKKTYSVSTTKLRNSRKATPAMIYLTSKSQVVRGGLPGLGKRK